MSEVSIELLSMNRAIALWPQIAPLAEQSVRGNDMSASDMDAQYIFNAICADEAVIFAGFIDGKLEMILGFQFSDANGRKCADIIAMAGKHLTMFKRRYWDAIMAWLLANNVEFVDSYVPINRAVLYMNKFGFDKSCAHIRMSLGN